MKGKGRYGMVQGDEFRVQTASVEEHRSDNAVLEGENIRTLRRLVRAQTWDGVTQTGELLRTEGHKQYRIDAMISMAMAGVKIR